jgi:hypothetical protein
MSNTSDVINLIRDIITEASTPTYEYVTDGEGGVIQVITGTEPIIEVPVYKFSNGAGDEGKERIVINSIPVNQSRSGALKQNNDIVNVNLFVPKVFNYNNYKPDSKRIEILDALIQTAIESFDGTTSRVGYYYLDVQPSQTFNESDKETITNIRIEVTYT